MPLEEKIKVMTAYLNGEPIEICDNYRNEWRNITNPSWDWAHNDYRIKPKPPNAYRAYESGQEMYFDFCRRFPRRARMSNYPSVMVVRNNDPNDVELIPAERLKNFEFGFKWVLRTHYSFDDFFNKFEYLDGSPVGKLVEE